MINNKLNLKCFCEKAFITLILLFIITNAIIQKDSVIAVISAICGILYTFLAGKGLPICYLFGITGSSFYGLLSFQNALWGNLILYIGYYLPMQILGYFKWSKNLQDNKKEIIKIKLPQKELFYLIFILSILSTAIYFLLKHLNDSKPILDSITTVFSIGGMYLTVRRAIEQWIFWMIVNTLSFIMWITVALNGIKVYSTIIMWGVYLILAIYFYITWSKEINKNLI